MQLSINLINMTLNLALKRSLLLSAEAHAGILRAKPRTKGIYVSVGLRRPSNTAYRLEVPVDMDCSTPKRMVSNLTVLMTVVPVAQ
jgi:hypothetical protein